LHVGKLEESVLDINSRLELIELGHHDIIKKFRILESINLGVNDD
jgi:hypothetical protein